MAGEAQGMHSAGSRLFVSHYGQAAPAGLADVTTDWVPGEFFGVAAGWKGIPELIDCNGVDVKPTVTRVTHLRSPGKAQEKVPGFKDSNQLACRFNYSSALQFALSFLIPGASGAIDAPLGAANLWSFWGRKKFFIMLPDGGGWYFTAFMAGSPTQVPEDDRVTLDISIEISGLPLFIALA